MTPLQDLARSCGIQLDYWDTVGQQHHASPESLLRVLQILGIPIKQAEDARDAHRRLYQDFWRRGLEPVGVAWDGTPNEMRLRLPERVGGVVGCRLELESGEVRSWSSDVGALPVVETADVTGVRYCARRLNLPGGLPLGYHRLTVEQGSQTFFSQILSAPVQASTTQSRKTWGLFAPLYALHSKHSWGAGDFTDLENLVDWVRAQGGGMVATLPLLAAFLDEPFNPSPYAPASRLFWNEFYLDVARIPELQQSPRAQALLAAPEFREEIQALRAEPLVDYRAQMALKRRVLEELAQTLFAAPSARLEAFKRFVAANPQAQDYARFRAVVDRRREPWALWPAPLCDGTITEADFDSAVERYHLYVQWLCGEQLQSLAAKARAAGDGLYLDLPLGVNADSYDVWRERAVYATGVSAGAPPDPFFPGGQNWGFPPLHPENIRTQGYRHLVAYLRHHLKLAGVLRIDHMMGLHRLFWIPQGMPAGQGVYVSYPAEEQYAVFCLEARRHGSTLVGEDLGTVPPEVPPTMARHAIHRMYVMQYQINPWGGDPLGQVFPGAVASVNTHDMPPFAAFWQALDIQDRFDLRILDEGAANHARHERNAAREALLRALRERGLLPHDKADLLSVLRASQAYLAAGPARLVLATLEDLWGETQPQNVPGTWLERPNWRRRAKKPLEAFGQMPELMETLRTLDRTVKNTR
jgi:4-alpha-glucanotransferase